MNGRPIQLLALCFVVAQDRVLLLKRSPSKKIYPSKWDGVGGKVEVGETPLQACCREVEEEAGIYVPRPVLRAVLTFLDEQYQCEWLLFAFRASEYHGQLLEHSPDGELRWVPLSEVASLDAVPDLKLYIEPVVRGEGEILFGHFEYDNTGVLRRHTLATAPLDGRKEPA